MGGRGARSASGSIAAVPVLDFHLVQRANGASALGNAGSRRGDAIAKANAAVDSHMRQVRRDAEKASRQRAKERRAAAVKKALDSGALSFTLDGVTYARKTRRSRSFISVS